MSLKGVIISKPEVESKFLVAWIENLCEEKARNGLFANVLAANVAV